MEKADSVMEAEHAADLVTAKTAKVDGSPAFKDLEARHTALITKHKDVMQMPLCRPTMPT
jgi:hypothetical protein